MPIPRSEIDITAARSGGAGGQNVNKVSSAAHLRFNVRASSLPAAVKARLLALSDNRITADGVVVIRAQEERTFERNRDAALARLEQLVASVRRPPRRRVATKPTKGSVRRRVEAKKRRGAIKALRGDVRDA